MLRGRRIEVVVTWEVRIFSNDNGKPHHECITMVVKSSQDQTVRSPSRPERAKTQNT